MTTNPPRPDRAFRPARTYRRGDLVPQTWVWAVAGGEHVHSRIPAGGERCHLSGTWACRAGFGPLRVLQDGVEIFGPRIPAPAPPPIGPAEVGAALASLRNIDWSTARPTIILPPALDAPAPPDTVREGLHLVLNAAAADEEPYNFVVVRRDGDDLAAAFDRDGQALVDDPAAGGVRTFPTVQDLIEAYGGDRRVKLVWERDQWPPDPQPPAEFNADMARQAAAEMRERYRNPYRRSFPPPFPPSLPASSALYSRSCGEVTSS